MGYRLLFDEMTEASLARDCTQLGHDTERVVAVPSLGAGSDDGEIVAYAETQNRLLVTYDQDFLQSCDATTRIGILYKPDDRTPPRVTATVIDAIANEIEQTALVRRRDPAYLTTEWV